jgi:hypothetical protein
MAVDTEDRAREQRLRRLAARQGFSLQKSRIRDPRAFGHGGYMLVDDRNCCVCGGWPYAYSSTLDDIEAFLAQ